MEMLPSEFLQLTKECPEIWEELKGGKIYHKDLGFGLIVEVSQCPNLISVDYENTSTRSELKRDSDPRWYRIPYSFQDGTFTKIYCFSSINEKVLSYKKKLCNDFFHAFDLESHLEYRFLSVNKLFENFLNKASNITPSMRETLKEGFKEEKAKFVQEWIHKKTGCRLDKEQAAAVASLDKNIQVIARAGSGKTRTIVNRALFLLKHCGIPAGKMLLLAFNKKAAFEMRERILKLLHPKATELLKLTEKECAAQMKGNRDGIRFRSKCVDLVARQLQISLPHVMTFHALAYGLVHPDSSPLYDSSPENILSEGKITEDVVSNENTQQLSYFIQKIIDDYVRSHDAELRGLMLTHFREDWNEIIEGGYDKEKTECIEYRRSLPRLSIRGETVKYAGEKFIADFLFEHNVPYEYKGNYGFAKRQSSTYFKIAESESSEIRIIYKDFEEGLGFNGKSEPFLQNNSIKLLEFSSFDLEKHGLQGFRELLKKNLESNGQKCEKLSDEELWQKIRDRAIGRFTKACTSFIQRSRTLSLSPKELAERIKSHTPISEAEKLFLSVASRLYKTYLEKLHESGSDDFNGLLQKAVEKIRNGETFFDRKESSGDLLSIQYISIDEFQDFSDLFYRLLQSVKQANSEVNIFCVGDDWQAINGFAGSDLKYFQAFCLHFNVMAHDYVQLNLSTNYRSARTIVNTSNRLMDGLGVPAKPSQEREGNLFLANIDEFSLEPSEGNDIYQSALLRIIYKYLSGGEGNITILSRKNESITGATLDTFLEGLRKHLSPQYQKRLSISSVHSYKGAESGTIIIADAFNKHYPLIHPDWSLSRLFGDTLEKVIEEEKRLFYVGLTRAVDILIIVTSLQNKSPFLNEISPIQTLNWDSFPPIALKKNRNHHIIRVLNGRDEGPNPTVRIKDLLKKSGYTYKPQTKDGACWERISNNRDFSIDRIKAEEWSPIANNIQVKIFNESNDLLEMYTISHGEWNKVSIQDY